MIDLVPKGISFGAESVGKECNYNQILVWINNIQNRFLCGWWKDGHKLEQIYIDCLCIMANRYPIEGSPQNPSYHSVVVFGRFQSAPQLNPHDAESRQSLGQLCVEWVQFFLTRVDLTGAYK